MIPAAYLYVEGFIVFTFQFVSKADAWAYTNVSNALIRASVLSLQQCFAWACSIVSSAELLEGSAVLLYPRQTCKLKGVLFLLFGSSLRLISGPTVMSPQ